MPLPLHRRLLPLLLALPALVLAQAQPQVPAFPGAAGPAAQITGGRGGELYVVTNTNRDGPGSLADAVSQGNRIIVFATSGLIDLSQQKKDRINSGTIAITQPNITILGQTAPGEGICLKGGALTIEADNVIVRYLRSRRGFVRDGDSGDAIEVKPPATDEKVQPGGRTQEAFDKVKLKKEKRGKEVRQFAPLSGILIDHCSTSWATDENLTCTHADLSTVQWCIAAEGLDYANPKQTPPNHSEGSLWGSAAPHGTTALHHCVYAHNRLRNPRATGGSDDPPILTLFNTVVYNWSEEPSHTGSERVLINWVNNLYKPGPNTPADLAALGFRFCGDLDARVYAHGNVFPASPAATSDNHLAIAFAQKLRELDAAGRQRMISDQPFGTLPTDQIQTVDGALSSILADAGASLPARDAVDLRILRSVRDGTGRIIEKETDLPADQRWPDYQSLPAPADTDHDGLPDAWQTQFNLHGATTITAHGYANIEHYANNTDPTGKDRLIVHVQSTISRATAKEPGQWQITRHGDLSQPLTVHYQRNDTDTGPATITIPANQASIQLDIPLSQPNQSVTLTLLPTPSYATGCPFQSLVLSQ